MKVLERQAYVSVDLSSRNHKALKIERLLDLTNRMQPVRMLEIGTGSGGIAHYFATHPTLRCDVDAVDVRDNRLIRNGYRFQLVEGTQLPFDSESFDVVITNHVIEHVGDSAAQRNHLHEIHRVMKPDGLGYIAVPNRWMLTEPHFQLKFLSWWPRAWRTSYLRLMRKGSYYDCEPLQMRQLERMLEDSEFFYRNLCVEAWRVTFEIELPASFFTRVLRATPSAMLNPLRRIIPTLIYRIERAC